jgi:spore coat protein A
MLRKTRFLCPLLAAVAVLLVGASLAQAEPVPGGSLDPTTIDKYVTPLVIPPVMDTGGDCDADSDSDTQDRYDIAVREFKQQILPTGMPATTVWSYGPSKDPTPTVAPDPNSHFNYPAYTIETITTDKTNVRWRNQLVKNPDRCRWWYPKGDRDCDYIEHLLAVDQTLHWANPPMDCRAGDPRTDCAGDDPDFYTGPVPIITHVHGAHVNGHSDGYPEAWFLPGAGNIPKGYARNGMLFDDAVGRSNGDRGLVDFAYRNDQPATTLWYHDHSLGMTRLNVYAGPAGFWLIRGGKYDKVKKPNGRNANLPEPAPVAGEGVLPLNTPGHPTRNKIREIPIVIQDRSFDDDGSLFYPDNRAFFEGLNVEDTAGTPDAQFPGEPELQIDFVPSADSDIAPIWNPEAFFNTMVVNGVTWPNLDVAPARYRLRLLNGCNSRFLNLAMFVVNPNGTLGQEIPFFQIGADQGFLPQVVRVATGEATPLPGNGTIPPTTDNGSPQALLMIPAERADVIVDFSDLPNGTVVRMINTAPDAPFGGFPDDPADPGTTGQVMEFTVDNGLTQRSDRRTTSPYELNPVAEAPQGAAIGTRELSLNEGESELVCVEVDGMGNTVQVDCSSGMGVEFFAPKEALLGLVDGDGGGIPLKWTDTTDNSTPTRVKLENGKRIKVAVSENPIKNTTEDWEFWNFTEDAHPIHMHLVRFEVISRRNLDGSDVRDAEPSEFGYKDTVIAYPDEITKVRATFDLAGLYVWHCHIVEHEDNEMMRPYIVSRN